MAILVRRPSTAPQSFTKLKEQSIESRRKLSILMISYKWGRREKPEFDDAMSFGL